MANLHSRYRDPHGIASMYRDICRQPQFSHLVTARNHSLDNICQSWSTMGKQGETRQSWAHEAFPCLYISPYVLLQSFPWSAGVTPNVLHTYSVFPHSMDIK